MIKIVFNEIEEIYSCFELGCWSIQYSSFTHFRLISLYYCIHKDSLLSFHSSYYYSSFSITKKSILFQNELYDIHANQLASIFHVLIRLNEWLEGKNEFNKTLHSTHNTQIHSLRSKIVYFENDKSSEINDEILLSTCCFFHFFGPRKNGLKYI